MKTVLVTGGAGFIGSTFVRHLFNTYPDYKIVVVDCLTYAGDIENLPVDCTVQNHPNFEFWYGNVTNGVLMDTLVSRADIVVHFAAETHVTRSIYDNTQFFVTDVLGTQSLCNAICKYRDRIERFIHISTSEVYGTALDESIHEDHALNPMSPYASAKCGADRLVYSYFTTYHLPAVIIRPFNNYGPRQHLEKLLPRFITSMILGEPMRVHGDGTAARDFIHAEDNCRAIDMIMHAPGDKVVGEVFNVGSGSHISILEIANEIQRVFGKKCEISFVGDRPGQVNRHTACIEKIRERLGWKPQISWEDGLRSTIDWYKNNQKQWQKQMWMREIPIITSDNKKELH